jgi:hypothetical protein
MKTDLKDTVWLVGRYESKVAGESIKKKDAGSV